MHQRFLVLFACTILSPAAFGLTDKIMTVTGAEATADFNLVLPHEHILADLVGADQVGPHRYDEETVYQAVRPHLERAQARGVDLLVECTPAYIARDPRLMQRLSKSTGLRILTNTGLYGAGRNRFLPDYAHTESAAELAARWIAEWNEGIEDSGIRPGFIKIGVDPDPALTALHSKLVLAAALTHRATGLTIACHTGRGPGLAQLAILRAEGVAPSAWIWVHAQHAEDEDLLDAARAGAWLSFDGLRPNSLERHLHLCQLLRDHGLLDRVLLSHDAGWYDPGKPEGGEFRDYELLFSEFLPLLRKHGFTAAEEDLLLRKNPIRAFTVNLRLIHQEGAGLTSLPCLPVGAGFAYGTGDDGFADLFDGSTLNGWVKASGPSVAATYRGGEWRIEEGAITGHQSPPEVGSFLHTEREYGDFELMIDLNPDWGCDSGIFLRTNARGQCIQIFVDYLPRGNIGFVFGQGTGGFSSMPWELEAITEGGEVVGVRAVDKYDGVAMDGLLYSAPAEDFNRVWKHGEFNTLKIRMVGPEPHITTWVNGVKMMEMDGTTFRGRHLRDMRRGNFDAATAWNHEKIREQLGLRGTIGLQVHPGPRWDGTVRYKNIRIRELTEHE
ncbi:MAG: DUF1080 domain-containing protein [Puniceicoccaceae bacterium]|nr:MAG: DUF1080 domain-containing protein [Puniceicoccaceae bacterium]